MRSFVSACYCIMRSFTLRSEANTFSLGVMGGSRAVGWSRRWNDTTPPKHVYLTRNPNGLERLPRLQLGPIRNLPKRLSSHRKSPRLASAPALQSVIFANTQRTASVEPFSNLQLGPSKVSTPKVPVYWTLHLRIEGSKSISHVRWHRAICLVLFF